MLIDYDVHSNYGNWIYVSGVENDPRDRFFNLKRQAEIYDGDRKFRKMVKSNDKKNISLIFPNQLFKNSDLIDKAENIYIIEECLFLSSIIFKQKILFHRMSMKFMKNIFLKIKCQVH